MAPSLPSDFTSAVDKDAAILQLLARIIGNGHAARFLSRANDAGWLCAITPCETADLVILDHLQQAPVSAAPGNKGDSGGRVEHLLGTGLEAAASKHLLWSDLVPDLRKQHSSTGEPHVFRAREMKRVIADFEE